MRLRNLYVLVQDTDRAVDFYTKILEFKLLHKEDRYTILEFDEVYFGLLNEKYEGKVIRGNNCVPVFEVENVDEWYQKLQKANVIMLTDMQQLPSVKYFQFFDTEGNILEIYQEL
jgi:predicted enzyme related to lactoylglutathione lyase